MNLAELKRRLIENTRVGALLALIVLCLAGWQAFEWTVNRVYVPAGESLLLRYRGLPIPFLPGKPQCAPGAFAKVDEHGRPLECGVLEQMVGPGRHFYCPLWWETTRVKDTVIEPGHVALVTSKMGDDLPAGEYLVDGDLDSTTHKGILRKVLVPGTYRVNPYAYEVEDVATKVVDAGNQKKHTGWVKIPAGYVGVVTNLANNPITGAKTGIQRNVLQPGIYPVNGKEQHVDIVEIGYREKSIIANLKLDKSGDPILDESGEPVIADDDSSIGFPSNDGFEIHMDFTAIWGIMPDQAPHLIDTFGNVSAVETKVVIPQMESICRNMGSKLGAVELLVGDSRKKFQEETAKAFQKVLNEKNITLKYGLVRHIYIPQEVRLPIQESFIADEKKITAEQQQKTTRTEALLREAESRVQYESQRVRVETDKLVASAIAIGQKTAEETRAETKQKVAAVDRKTAELDAQATVVLGEATAAARKLMEEAKAQKFQLAVEAFGSGNAYNQWVFATGLPDDIKLNLLYAGEGTFWTELKGFTETMLGRQVKALQESPQPPKTAPTANRAAKP